MMYGLGDVIEAAKCSERIARYILEQGIVSVPEDLLRPGTGNHRNFTPCTARQIAIAAVMLTAGFKSPKVKEVVDKATVAIAGGTNPLRIDLPACGDKDVEVRLDTTNIMQRLPV